MLVNENKVFGWERVEMVRKYAHFSSEHLAEYVDRLSQLRTVGNGELATIGLHSIKWQRASLS